MMLFSELFILEKFTKRQFHQELRIHCVECVAGDQYITFRPLAAIARIPRNVVIVFRASQETKST